MSTIPSYPVATTPLDPTDQIILEQGSGVDRTKRASVQMILDKTTLELGGIVAAQTTDTSLAVGDFLAGENAGAGKKFPVEAFEFAPVVHRCAYTGTKSFRLTDATGVGSFTDNLFVSGDNQPSIISTEGTGRIELYVAFKFNPTLVVSSSRGVGLVMSDVTDTDGPSLLAALLNVRTPKLVYAPASYAIPTGIFVGAAILASLTASEIALAFYKADGSTLKYSDVYHASTTSAILMAQVRLMA